MKFTTIRIEGSILSPDILDKIEQGELGGQRPEDFHFESNIKVKDEIIRAWADAHDLWRVFSHQRERIGDKGTGTSETRKYWILPFLGILGYDAENARAEEINGKSYAISHRASKLDGFPIHIMGFNDSLDKKRDDSGPRMSPHALVQEYVNITEHLYAIVTNGIHLRLLRDSSRLVKLSFIEFDLQSMMEEEHFADFAIMYRLLHASRMPVRQDAGAESVIEKYHQDALDSGSRIREGLSEAVENSIKILTEGFLNHPNNAELRDAIESGRLSHVTFYKYQLRLIYRLLFLMVIEERNLIYPPAADQNKLRIYYDYYSIGRLRALSEKVYRADKGYNDLWIGLKNTFRLFEKEYYGQQLEIKPLAGELFGPGAIGVLDNCNLDNSVLLECLRNLSVFTNKNNNQKMRVNYASLNVEEFGSVYEGLLEYDPLVEKQNGHWHFIFIKGEGRSASGSHYTPDELVQPLIKHSLDYIIEDKLKEPDKEKSLLSITVCDVACGSGHILLNAARRIATELAKVRTGEDQPSPTAFREAVRDVIRNCIYGVDKNPLAVELCKIALWLEAHNPGQPLNFLDHHIKCGDSIVGLAHIEELENGIVEEAFKRLPDDDKDVCSAFRKANKAERNGMLKIDFEGTVGGKAKGIVTDFNSFSSLPERTPEDIEEKRKAYMRLTSGEGWHRLKTLADIVVAQFFITKGKESQNKIITDGPYRQYLAGEKQLLPQAVAMAEVIASKKGLFHWFLEFPEVFAQGGFDCILGNPPFLGGQKISGTYGHDYLNWLKFYYGIVGSCDIVTYFFRRNFNLIRTYGLMSLISTNSISQGVAREGGLEVILRNGGAIVFAVPSQRWPGRAAVQVSLISIYKGTWKAECIINHKRVTTINSFLEDTKDDLLPFKLTSNKDICFMGSTVVGAGFILTPQEAKVLIAKNERHARIILPYLNGNDLNSDPFQRASRYIINFGEMPLRRAHREEWDDSTPEQRKHLDKTGIVDPAYSGAVAYDFPELINIIESRVRPSREKEKLSEKAVRKWWQFYRPTIELYNSVANLERVIATAQVSKTTAFDFVDTKQVFDAKLIIFALEDFASFAILQSAFHVNWAWKYCTTMKADLSYGPERLFLTYPFPLGYHISSDLMRVGEYYHEHRHKLMLALQIGLTKTYNLFHKKNLSVANIEKESKQPRAVCEKAYQDILILRGHHVEMDNAVLSAYKWTDINLAHDFYEVDYLPENDRIRFTIHPDARREVLKRLLKLNHEIHEQEVKAGLWDKKKIKTPKLNKTEITKPDEPLQSLLPEIDVDVLAATSYPATAHDEMICAAALSIVEQSGGLTSVDHLDALLLVTHPEWCKLFLEQNDVSSFNKSVASVTSDLFVAQGQSIRWKDCRDYLEQRNAITVNRMQAEQAMTMGNDLVKVMSTLPQGTDKIVAYALKALRHIKNVRNNILLSQEQQDILRIFEQQHKQYYLAA